MVEDPSNSTKVFVSYSSRDRQEAESLCRALEERGIHCWIAPRDVPPGSDWDEAIIDAIDESGAMVLVLSENSNESVHVKHEVERAVGKAKAVFPVRIADVLPSKKLALHISTRHWVDLWPPPMEPAFDRLAGAIAQLLQPNLNGPNHQVETVQRIAFHGQDSPFGKSQPSTAIVYSPLGSGQGAPDLEPDRTPKIATPAMSQPLQQALTQAPSNGQVQGNQSSDSQGNVGPTASSGTVLPGLARGLLRPLGQTLPELKQGSVPSRGEIEKNLTDALMQITTNKTSGSYGGWFVNDSNSRRVFSALRSALGPVSEPVMREVLNSLVSDQEPMTRWKAMRLLLYLGIENTDLVRKYWLNEPDPAFRAIVLEASDQLPKEPGVALLLDIAQSDDTGTIRCQALEKLINAAGTDFPQYVAPAVESGLKDSDQSVRAKALCTAVDIDRQYAVEFARSALSHEAPYSPTLITAVGALGSHGDLSDLARLGEALSRNRFNEYSFSGAVKRLAERFGRDAVLAKANQLSDEGAREAACRAASS